MFFLAAQVILTDAFSVPNLKSNNQIQSVEGTTAVPTVGSVTKDDGVKGFGETVMKFAFVSLVSMSLLSAPAHADGQTAKFKLPPIDFSDKSRCSLKSSTIGQANAARDKLYDLRQCKLDGAAAPGYDLSGVIMTDTDVSKADFKEAQFSKGYLHGKIRYGSCLYC